MAVLREILSSIAASFFSFIKQNDPSVLNTDTQPRYLDHCCVTYPYPGIAQAKTAFIMGRSIPSKRYEKELIMVKEDQALQELYQRTNIVVVNAALNAMGCGLIKRSDLGNLFLCNQEAMETQKIIDNNCLSWDQIDFLVFDLVLQENKRCRLAFPHPPGVNPGYRGVKRTVDECYLGTSFYEPGCQYDPHNEEDGLPTWGGPWASGCEEDSRFYEGGQEVNLFKNRCLSADELYNSKGCSSNYAGDGPPKINRAGGVKSRPVANTRSTRKQSRKKSNKVVRAMAREASIALASNLVGEPVARMGYQMSAKAFRGGKRSAHQKTLELSLAASKYLKAHVDGFSSDVSHVGIPRPPATRSFKVTGFARGSGAIGAANMGFVACAPTVCNDLPCVYSTTSVFGLSNASAPPSDLLPTDAVSIAGGARFPASSTMGNLPYSSAQLAPTIVATGSSTEIAGRIVSHSLRVWFTGTDLNQAGQYYGYSDPDCNNVLGPDHASTVNGGGYFISQLAQKDATEIIIVKKGQTECQLVRLATDPSMDDYPRNNSPALRKLFPLSSGEYYTLGGTVNCGVASLIVMIDGVAGQTFYWEAITHVEYIGTGVMQAAMSESNNDAVGYDAVKNILQHAQRECANNPRITFNSAVKAEMRRQGVRMGRGQRSVDY